MKPNKYDLVLFDMDGTLIDSDPMLLETFHILYDLYNNGKQKEDKEILKFSGPPIRETLRKEFPHQDQELMFKEFSRISSKLYDNKIYLYPDTIEVLKDLKSHGCKLGVVTNKMHNMTMVALNNLKLTPYFDLVVGYDDVKIGKPDPEGINKAIALLGSQKAIYLGDNDIDLVSANNAHIDSILVHFAPREVKHPELAIYEVNSYNELGEIIYGKSI